MYLGFYPDTSSIEGKYFNIEAGVFQSTDFENICFEGPQVEYFKRFFSVNTKNLNDIKLTKDDRKLVLELILTYYSFHVQGYHKPKSLAILNQLFN